MTLKLVTKSKPFKTGMHLNIERAALAWVLGGWRVRSHTEGSPGFDS